MATAQIDPLPYPRDVSVLFARLRRLPAPVWLDSGGAGGANGRFDILAAAPLSLIRESISLNSVSYNNNLNFFSHVEQWWEQQLEPLEPTPGIPFAAGAIGLLGYDLGRQLEKIPTLAKADIELPTAAVGYYAAAVVIDHTERRALLASHPDCPAALRAELLERLHGDAPAPPEGFRLESALSSNLDRETYGRAFARIRELIHAGDCYQVNLAQRFTARFSGSPWELYPRLRSATSAPFSAWLEFDDSGVMCLSPERFIQLEGSTVLTQPIKGTAPRDPDPERDAAQARALENSAKNRAENLMIVDLLRNDLGRSCAPGSIEVPQLFELNSFATVHHLISTVRGRLADGVSPWQLLARAFPGGSITGAPKVRAMQIIESLEPHRRSAYCGSVFYLSACGRMDSNIAIRSLVWERDRIHLWAGGGIVADSDCEAEYRETLHKVQRLMDEMEVDEGPGARR